MIGEIIQSGGENVARFDEGLGAAGVEVVVLGFDRDDGTVDGHIVRVTATVHVSLPGI